MPTARTRKPGVTKGREAARGEGPPRANKEGWQGWDAYADFYDWENAQTLDRRDVTFWQGMAQRANGPILELGCGTGRDTQALIEAVGAIGGAYYLPYRRHATLAQFTAIYPRGPEFAALKRRVDPGLLFRNALWDTYLTGV